MKGDLEALFEENRWEIILTRAHAEGVGMTRTHVVRIREGGGWGQSALQGLLVVIGCTKRTLETCARARARVCAFTVGHLRFPPGHGDFKSGVAGLGPVAPVAAGTGPCGVVCELFVVLGRFPHCERRRVRF